MGMNKKSIKTGKSSDQSDDQLYEVEKIVNQRIINGKKQYKVIWVGYSFEDATWEPEENLNCQEKIDQFLRRYQDVVRRKMMGKQAPNGTGQSLTKTNNTITPEKTGSTANQTKAQKTVTSNTPLNKSKIQQSAQKSTISQKTLQVSDIKTKPTQTQSKKQVQKQKVTESIQIQPTKTVQSKLNLTSSNLNNKKQVNTLPTSQKPSSKIVEQMNEQSSQTQVQDEQKFVNNNLPVDQRLDVVEILGMIEPQDDDQPLFFLIKNRFQKNEVFVQRERLLNECPEKMIEFYESLIESS